MGRCLVQLFFLLDALFFFGHFALPYSLFATKAIMEASWFPFSSVLMWAEIQPNQAIVLPKEKETHAECSLQNRDDLCSGLISSIWWPAHHQNREGLGCYHCSDKCHFPVPCCHAVLEGSSISLCGTIILWECSPVQVWTCATKRGIIAPVFSKSPGFLLAFIEHCWWI